MGFKVANFVLQIIESAINVELVTKYFRWDLISQDPDDNKFVDCAIASNARFIISNDKHFNILSKIEFPKVEVISLDDFSKIMKHE